MLTTVLIVDDSKLARIAIAKAIAALQPNWLPVQASCDNEALARLVDGRIDLALFDYNMPGRHGTDVASDFRALFPAMPIAIVSANTQPEIINRTRAINAVFIEKPINADKLRAFVSGAAFKVAPTSI
jgi:DNA-binding NarL/FixJ family response regulator